MTRKANRFKGKRVAKHFEVKIKMDVDGATGIHFNEEIVVDILSRLPVRSLLRFKCVSKIWMALISEPYFTMKHLKLAKNNQNSPKILFLKDMFTSHLSSWLLYRWLNLLRMYKNLIGFMAVNQGIARYIVAAMAWFL
ncbi:hypothetical protein FXO38_23544 [Capsicum annuum]|nr:hypothetical protein FXO38_23544 [Capsicum annuum]